MRFIRNYYFLIISLLCVSCATPSMWVIKNTTGGGVIGASNYTGVTQKKIEDDLKEVVSCPNSYVITDISNKSQAYQSSFVLKNPDQVTTVNQSSYIDGNVYSNNNYYRTTASFNANASGTTTITQDGGYSVVPYTSMHYWNEIAYRCADTNVCLSGNSSECIVLADRAIKDGDMLKANHLLEKVCHERTDDFSSLACYALSINFIMIKQDLNTALRHFKRGCDLNKGYKKGTKQFQLSMESCAFFGAHSKNKFYYDFGTKNLTEQCILGSSPNDCYNLLCSQSLYGDVNSALATLRRTVKLGYKDYKHLLADPDLRNIRNTREFIDIVEELKRKNTSIYGS